VYNPRIYVAIVQKYPHPEAIIKHDFSLGRGLMDWVKQEWWDGLCKRRNHLRHCTPRSVPPSSTVRFLDAQTRATKDSRYRE